MQIAYSTTKKRVFIAILSALLIQATYVSGQCQTVTNQVLQVTAPSTTAPSCSDATQKRYQLSFTDITYQIQYAIQQGVYVITTNTGVSLNVVSSATVTTSYALTQIIVRGIPMFELNKSYYSLELQLYFSSQSGDNIALSSFYNSVSSSSSSASTFFSTMNPQIVGDYQSINFASTLQNDFKNTTFILESSGIIYNSKTYTWLVSTQINNIRFQDFELFRYAWTDPYSLQSIDSISIGNGVCSLSAPTQLALCVNSEILFASLISFVLLFILY